MDSVILHPFMMQAVIKTLVCLILQIRATSRTRVSTVRMLTVVIVETLQSSGA